MNESSGGISSDEDIIQFWGIFIIIKTVVGLRVLLNNKGGGGGKCCWGGGVGTCFSYKFDLGVSGVEVADIDNLAITRVIRVFCNLDFTSFNVNVVAKSANNASGRKTRSLRASTCRGEVPWREEEAPREDPETPREEDPEPTLPRPPGGPRAAGQGRSE
jgi:hypothetical protein